MERQLPLQHGGCGENLAPTFTTHVKQPPVPTVTHKTVSEARPCLNVRVGGGLIAHVLPQACPTSMTSMLERPGGCKSPGGHAEGHGSLPNKVKCQAGGHVDVKKIEHKGVSNIIPCLSSKDYMRDMSSTTSSGLTVVSKKPLQSQTTCAASKNVSVAMFGKGDMSPSPCSGQGGMSSNMMNEVSGKSKWVLDTHATHDFHNFDSVSKSGQGGKGPCSMPPMNGRQGGMSPTTNNRQIDVPKKPQQIQATHAYSNHDSVAKDDMGGMSSITTSRLIGVPNKPQHEATHAFSKHTNKAKFGKGGTSTIMNNGMGDMSPTTRQGGVSPTMKKQVGENYMSMQHTQATQKNSKYESVLIDGQRSKCMLNNPHGMPNMNGRGMNKTSRHTKTKNGPTKNQRLCATCRSQEAVRVEQDQVGHQGGHRLVKSKHPSFQPYGKNKHVSHQGELRQTTTHGLVDDSKELKMFSVQPRMRQKHRAQNKNNVSNEMAQAKEHETPCKPSKARQVD
ncbi:unnamed protein product [Linum trigynum]|uniref:Uncharacterized protein n=1 Tax=Linum trigynum TaxID=586398 RepID=A0AAV2GKW5_9ROSI